MQREAYRLLKNGKKDPKKGMSLSEERIRRLEEAGIRWKVMASPKRRWEERYQDLLEFKDTRGHTIVPLNYPANPSLALWVRNQQKSYQLMMDGKKSPGLTEEKVRLLDEVDFCWRRHAFKNRAKTREGGGHKF